jgi:ribosomal protein L37AE/L43A
MKWVTEIVNGVCPDCAKESVLISVDQFFKCTRCGMELEQKVNGKISYIPAIEKGENITMILRNDGEES